jgi:hypothetical protein
MSQATAYRVSQTLLTRKDRIAGPEIIERTPTRDCHRD